jgi:hypothetical protein
MRVLILTFLFWSFVGGQNVQPLQEDIPEIAKSFLPENGGVFISGGLMSVGRMVVFDLDSKQVTFFEGEQKNKAANPETDIKTTTTLSKEKLGELEHHFRMVFFSPQLFVNNPPLADFDTLLVMQLQGPGKTIHSYGPPMSYLENLYTFLWQLKEE